MSRWYVPIRTCYVTTPGICLNGCLGFVRCQQCDLFRAVDMLGLHMPSRGKLLNVCELFLSLHHVWSPQICRGVPTHLSNNHCIVVLVLERRASCSLRKHLLTAMGLFKLFRRWSCYAALKQSFLWGLEEDKRQRFYLFCAVLCYLVRTALNFLISGGSDS